MRKRSHRRTPWGVPIQVRDTCPCGKPAVIKTESGPRCYACERRVMERKACFYINEFAASMRREGMTDEPNIA